MNTNFTFSTPFTYDPRSGRWSVELHKAPKDVFAQSGIRLTIDPGIPTGEEKPMYQSAEPSGLLGTALEIRCFDNLSGWTSAVTFDMATLMEKLIEIMPKDKVKTETFVLSKRDVDVVESINNKEVKKENK